MKLTRRHCLKAAGVSLALPWLDAMTPARAAAPPTPPRRMVLVCTPLGLHPANFFPEKPGTDYAPTPYLDVLKDFRDDFTVMSGLAHPEVNSGHDSIFSFLTAERLLIIYGNSGLEGVRADINNLRKRGII